MLLVVDLGCLVHCLVVLGVWHVHKENLHALQTWSKRNHKHHAEARNHETKGIQCGRLQKDRSRYLEHDQPQWRDGGDASKKEKPSTGTPEGIAPYPFKQGLRCLFLTISSVISWHINTELKQICCSYSRTQNIKNGFSIISVIIFEVNSITE